MKRLTAPALAVRSVRPHPPLRTLVVFGALVLGSTPASLAQMQLEFLTYHGAGDAAAVDDAGCLYVFGGTDQVGVVDEPLVPPVDASCALGVGPTPDNGMRWVAKLSPAGEILWSRALPGVLNFGITVDGAGTSVYLVGSGGEDIAAEFPLGVGWNPNSSPGRDSYLARLDAETGCPLAITFFGDHPGVGGAAQAVTIDPAGDVHVVGAMGAGIVPTQVLEGYSPLGTDSRQEAYAVGFDATLSTRHYYVYLPGGSQRDNATDVVADTSGIYVAGYSDSTDLPFAPQRLGPGGARDAWVMKFVPDPTGTELAPATSALEYGLWIGGSGDEAARGNSGIDTKQETAWLDVDASGAVTFSTWTASSDLPATASFGPGGNDDVLVTRIGPNGITPADPTPDYLVLVGGRRDDVVSGIARNRNTGRIYVCGGTKSADFPAPGGLVTSHGSAPNKFDGYLIELDDTTGGLVSGTFFGGSGIDDGRAGVEVDAAGFVHVVGARGSADFRPAPFPATTYELDHFAARLSFGPPPPPAAGISVAPTSGLVTTEAGDSDSFTVVLDTEPGAPVTIGVSTGDASEALVAAGGAPAAAAVVLAFDSTNWNVAQTVTVVGEDDADLDGDVAYSVVIAPASSADADYDGLDADDVAAVNVDDEAPPSIDVDQVTPGSMNSGATVAVTITGAGFQDGATVSFENGSGPAPSASNVVRVDGGTLTATLTVANGGPKGTRTWGVRVTNPDGSTGVLVDGFDVVK